MNLEHPYNREDFVKFITDFLPDDFEEEIKTRANHINYKFYSKRGFCFYKIY